MKLLNIVSQMLIDKDLCFKPLRMKCFHSSTIKNICSLSDLPLAIVLSNFISERINIDVWWIKICRIYFSKRTY